MQNSNTNDREVVDDKFRAHLKRKHLNMDIDSILDIIESEISQIKPHKDDADNPIIKGIKCDLNKNLIIGCIYKWQSQHPQPLTDDELEKLALEETRKFLPGCGENIMAFITHKKIFKQGYKANRGNYTVEDIEKAFEAGHLNGAEEMQQAIGRKSIHQTEYLDKEQYIASLLK